MPGIARVGVDAAGSTIVGALVPSVLIDGNPVAVVGAQVSGHGRRAHSGPTMASGSSTVFANGIPVCREGDSATCGHPTSGSPDVFAG